MMSTAPLVGINKCFTGNLRFPLRRSRDASLHDAYGSFPSGADLEHTPPEPCESEAMDRTTIVVVAPLALIHACGCATANNIRVPRGPTGCFSSCQLAGWKATGDVYQDVCVCVQDCDAACQVRASGVYHDGCVCRVDTQTKHRKRGAGITTLIVVQGLMAK
jgi:hypothetical protein